MDPRDALKGLSWTLIGCGALFYAVGVLWAGIASLASPGTPDLPEPITYALTAIGGILATNFGAVFGIAMSSGEQDTRLSMTRLFKTTPPRSNVDWLQVGAAWFYALSLLAAGFFWILDGFSAQSADVLRDMTLTLIGAIGGVGAVALNVQRS